MKMRISIDFLIPNSCVIFERDALYLGLYNENFLVNEEMELMERFIQSINF